MNLQSLLLTSACFALLAGPAFCDKVFFKASARDGGALDAGDAADFIEGKVTAETAESVTIRVEGGEMTVARADVLRIERDALTVKDIETREAASRVRLAAANAARSARHGQWAEANARRRAEPAAAREVRIEVDFRGLIPAQLFSFYDPIINRIDMDGLARAIEAYLRAELVKLRPGR